MIEWTERLRSLLVRDSFAICPWLSSGDFVSFCRERGIETSEEQLERFEKLGVLFPVARIKYPWVTHKIEVIDDGRRYRDLGLLQAGESWSGSTRTEWGRWRIRNTEDQLELLDEGHLWDPRQCPFTPWTNFRDEHGTHTETFYSMFQAYPLEIKMMGVHCVVDLSLFADGTDPTKLGLLLADGVSDIVKSLGQATPQDDTAFLAQALSTRYYPLTQTDRRTFSLREPRRGYDWHQFVRAWDASENAAFLEVKQEELRKRHQTIALTAWRRDPLARWYQLVRFVSVDKKSQLSGTAQYSQLLYSMEHMLRMFAKDAFDVDYHPPDEGRSWTNEDLYGKGIPGDPQRHLEFVVNQFHLNPRPKLIILVEGPSEEAVIPRIAREILNHDLSPLGIEVRALGGVGEYTGTKRDDKFGALAKLIDDYHYRQTIVMVVLDREGRVDQVTRKLLDARSRFFPGRMLTKPEYVRVGTRSVEFDNFDHNEIATALTCLASEAFVFSLADIAEAERAYDRKEKDPLSALFERRAGFRLNKIALLDKLTDALLRAVEKNGLESEMKQRPLLQIIHEAMHLAALNHQPITHDTWTKNQQSGYFGEVMNTE